MGWPAWQAGPSSCRVFDTDGSPHTSNTTAMPAALGLLLAVRAARIVRA